MTNKIIAGAFAVIVGGMAVKVFKTMRDNKQEEIMKVEVEEDEIQG